MLFPCFDGGLREETRREGAARETLQAGPLTRPVVA